MTFPVSNTAASPLPASTTMGTDPSAAKAVRPRSRLLSGVTRLLQIAVFSVYVLLAAISFWVWVFSVLFLVLRQLLRVMMLILLWASGEVRDGDGTAGPARVLENLSRWWRTGGRYNLFIYPFGAHLAIATRATRGFWQWSMPERGVAVLLSMLLVWVPGLFVVPRPHYVKIVDNNVIEHAVNQEARYLVHAVDLFDPSQTREYLNEPAWWLGKINEQGMKNRLRPGHYFRVWVVGLRWFYAPTLFPNIIAVTEVDRQGNPIESAAQSMPAPTTPTR